MSRFKVTAGRTAAKITGITGNVTVKMVQAVKTVPVVSQRQMKNSAGVPVWVNSDLSLATAKVQPEGAIPRMEAVSVDTPVTNAGKAVMDEGSLNLVVNVADGDGRNLDGSRLPRVTLDTLSDATKALWEAAMVATRAEVVASFPTLELTK